MLAAAVAYLASAGVQSGWVYYLGVDEFLADRSVQSRRVRLHGIVAAEELHTGAGRVEFRLSGTSGQVPVRYEGVVPEMFAAEREVVVEGRFDPASGCFAADVLMTKCASKYESGQAEEPPAGHPPIPSASELSR